MVDRLGAGVLTTRMSGITRLAERLLFLLPGVVSLGFSILDLSHVHPTSMTLKSLSLLSQEVLNNFIGAFWFSSLLIGGECT